MSKGLETIPKNQMQGKDLLSNLKFNESYAKFNKSLNRLETWEEAATNVMDMHYNKFFP